MVDTFIKMGKQRTPAYRDLIDGFSVIAVETLGANDVQKENVNIAKWNE